jgi:hypothetical protein
MELLGDVGQVEAHLVCWETVLILVQDKCTICAKCTIGIEIFLGIPDETPR